MFEGLKGLGDMAGMMKKVMEMKNRMEEIKEALGKEHVEGSAAGGMVRVQMSGKMEVLDLKIEREVVDPEQVELLESLCKAAFNDALAKTHELVKVRMKDAAGGLEIPGL